MSKSKITVIDHPLAQHKLTVMRMEETNNADFRRAAQELSMLLGYEATRDLKTVETRIHTPIEPMMAPVLGGRRPCIVSILRAGNGILDAMLRLLPEARVGFVGLRRDEETLEPVEYYFKAPAHLDERQIIMVDPMVATGQSATAAATRLKEAGARDIRFVCIIASPEGVKRFHGTHPDIPVITATVDEGLTPDGFIRPGLGDAGDRLFGTD